MVHSLGHPGWMFLVGPWPRRTPGLLHDFRFEFVWHHCATGCQTFNTEREDWKSLKIFGVLDAGLYSRKETRRSLYGQNYAD